jgi:hypothetical protein
MSEYIDIDVEYGDDPYSARLITNLDLAPDGPEHYPDRESGEGGSPLAQFLFSIDGLAGLDITGDEIHVRRMPDVEWHALIDEIRSALKEFFL